MLQKIEILEVGSQQHDNGTIILMFGISQLISLMRSQIQNYFLPKNFCLSTTLIDVRGVITGEMLCQSHSNACSIKRGSSKSTMES